jgi:hypothetical protein
MKGTIQLVAEFLILTTAVLVMVKWLFNLVTVKPPWKLRAEVKLSVTHRHNQIAMYQFGRP